MKIKSILSPICFLIVSWNIQANDQVPDILKAVEAKVDRMTAIETITTRGENIRSPARVHAQTYCKNYNSPESRCVWVSRTRSSAGNGKYWYKTLFQDFTGAFYWSKY